MQTKTGIIVLCLACTVAAADQHGLLNGDLEHEVRDFAWEKSGAANEYSGGIYTGPDTDFVVFNWADIDSGNAYDQWFDLTAGVFNLSFDFGQWGDLAGQIQRLSVSIFGPDESLVFSTSVSDVADGDGHWNGFESFNFDFTADTAGTYLLSFNDAGSDTISTDGVLDNVALNAVPTPGAAVVLGAGGIFALRRRR